MTDAARSAGVTGVVFTDRWAVSAASLQCAADHEQTRERSSRGRCADVGIYRTVIVAMLAHSK